MPSTIQVKYFKAIEWILFFVLCGISAVFMYGVLDKFFSGKTSFTQSESSIKELPTITLCFSNPDSRKTDYEYGSDFKIEYNIKSNRQQSIILNEGENPELLGEIIYLENLTTLYMRKCYKLTPVLVNDYAMESIKRTRIFLYFNESITLEDLPSLRIYITSEINSDGVVLNQWVNGKVTKINIDKGMRKAIELKQTQHNFLTTNTKCGYESKFKPNGYVIYEAKLI